MNELIDWHVHTNCSCDCQMDMSESCEAAIKSRLNGICFIDHIDFDPRDEGIGFFDWSKYLKNIQTARESNQNLTIKTGFELTWQKSHRNQIIEFLKGKEVDFILGSIHWFSKGSINERKTYRNRTFDEFINEYISEALDLLKTNLCHGFAHFDYFVLQTHWFYPKIKREDIFEWVQEVIDDIIKHDVSLEINTSAMRKGFNEPFPCWEFLNKFQKVGGNKVHLGSDAHESNHVGLFFNDILKKFNDYSFSFQVL